MSRGYFGIGIENSKTGINYGTLHRTAAILGASFIFTIGRRFKRQASDTTKSWKHIPTFSYKGFDHFYKNLPHDCMLVGVEMMPEARYIEKFVHPVRACYLLGAEDHGLTNKAIAKCHAFVRLKGDISMNVSVAGSIVLYDRITKDISRQ